MHDHQTVSMPVTSPDPSSQDCEIEACEDKSSVPIAPLDGGREAWLTVLGAWVDSNIIVWNIDIVYV